MTVGEIMKENYTNIPLLFTIVSALFLALSPQFFGFILPVIFIIPIYMALNGIKHRKKSGYLIALGILPLALAVSMLWMKYFYSILGNMGEEFARMSAQFRVSAGTIQFLTIGCGILSLVLFGVSILTFMKLIKYKQYFK
jgi:hypothetical protein